MVANSDKRFAIVDAALRHSFGCDPAFPMGLTWIATERMIADALTKAMRSASFVAFRPAKTLRRNRVSFASALATAVSAASFGAVCAEDMGGYASPRLATSVVTALPSS